MVTFEVKIPDHVAEQPEVWRHIIGAQREKNPTEQLTTIFNKRTSADDGIETTLKST